MLLVRVGLLNATLTLEITTMTDDTIALRELLEKGSDTTGDAGVNRDALAAEFHRTRKLAGAPSSIVRNLQARRYRGLPGRPTR